MNEYAGNRPANLLGQRITLDQLLGPAAGHPARPSRTALPAEPPLLLIVRLGLGLVCMALIVLGVGVTAVLPGPAAASEVAVSTTSASTAPARYERPAWVKPPRDYLTYIPGGTGPGPFPEPAAEPALETDPLPVPRADR